MKKYLSLILIIATIAFCITSCSSKENEIKEFSINSNGELIVTYEDGATESLGKVKEKGITATEINDAGELIVKYSDGTEENLGLVVSESVWRERDDSIYTTSTVNIRKEANMESRIIATVFPGQELERVATNGAWNKIVYEGKQYYIYAAYTTPDINEISFNNCESKVVYATEGMTLYHDPCADDYTVAQHNIKVNTQLIKVAENKNGTWIKLQYGDNTYYCRPTDVSDVEIPQTNNNPLG